MRPQKKGIDYFSMDVDFFNDPKLMYVSDRFEEKGELITIKLLCWIYANDGYYTDWNEEVALIFTKKNFTNVKVGLVHEVVNELVKRGFFTESFFLRFGILTSNGIQNRWKEATKRRTIEIKPEFIVSYCNKNDTESTVNDTVTPPNDTVTPPNDTESTQSKVKESKVKESKIDTYPNSKNLEAIDFEKLLKTFNETFGKKCRVIEDSTKNAFRARLKSGFTKNDIMVAMRAIKCDKHHLDSDFKWITLSFIARKDKLEMYSTRDIDKKSSISVSVI